MKRLKEEKELINATNFQKADTRQYQRMIRALVRAVREDAIKVMRQNCIAELDETCEECDRQERAIRRGNE